MSSSPTTLWLVTPAGQQAAGAYIDDTLKERAAEKGLLGRTPLAAQFPRQRVEVIKSDDAVAHVNALYTARGWTDGLPIVPPTTARVKSMLAFSERAAQDSLGEIDPLKGLATIEKIAANAVMAGCRAAYFPVVLAAVEAILDPAFNLRGVQTTDENIAPLLIVNGPVARDLDINASFGALGPGWQANASIGRAVRFVMNNLGGGWPGAVSFAGLGHPGRYTLCLAENEAQSPWPPLHVDAGFTAEQSTVTVTRAESIVNVTGGLEEIASVMGSSASAFQILWQGKPTVILAPTTAAELANRGLSKADVRRWLYDNSRWPTQQWQTSWVHKTMQADRWQSWVTQAALTGGIPPVRHPDDIVLIVAGGDVPIAQQVYCPSWGFPPAAITRQVHLPADWAQLCAAADAS
jgi:hypothetical protein